LAAGEYSPGQHARHLSRALQALNLGDRLADPVQPSRRDLAVDAALAVYGQGILWALTTETPEGVSVGLDEAWTGAPPGLIAMAADGAGISRARAALARSPLRRAEMTEAEQESELGSVRVVLRGLIRALQLHQPSRRRIAIGRGVRIGLVAIAAVVLIIVAAKLIQGPDLAAGKPWIASSADRDCDVTNGMCQGTAVNIFFHTRQEESPWVQIDLGSPKRISSITVTNRRDCCEERAVPMILETGLTPIKFTPVAEQKTAFTEWKAKFPPVMARYVRARVPRNTILHLEKIAVH